MFGLTVASAVLDLVNAAVIAETSPEYLGSALVLSVRASGLPDVASSKPSSDSSLPTLDVDGGTDSCPGAGVVGAGAETGLPSDGGRPSTLPGSGSVDASVGILQAWCRS